MCVYIFYNIIITIYICYMYLSCRFSVGNCEKSAIIGKMLTSRGLTSDQLVLFNLDCLSFNLAWSAVFL